MKEAGEPFRREELFPAAAGYYTDSRATCCRCPSTARLRCSRQQGCVPKGGLDGTARRHWKEFAGRCRQAEKPPGSSASIPPAGLRGARRDFSAWHNLPIGTGENGSPHGHRIQDQFSAAREALEMLADFVKRGWFTYRRAALRNQKRGASMRRMRAP